MEQDIKQLMDEFKGRFTVFVKAWNGFRTEFEIEMLWSIDDAVENHEDFTIGCFMHERKKKDDVMPFQDLMDSYYHIYNIMSAMVGMVIGAIIGHYVPELDLPDVSKVIIALFGYAISGFAGFIIAVIEGLVSDFKDGDV